jgi:hypothetical protein
MQFFMIRLSIGDAFCIAGFFVKARGSVSNCRRWAEIAEMADGKR